MPGEVKPQRIQLRRVKGWRLQDVSMALNGLPAVKCTRPGPFGNPFKVEGEKSVWTSGKAVNLFRCYLGTTGAGARLYYRAVAELRGKNLACFCRLDKPCHADVLLELANQPEPSHAT